MRVILTEFLFKLHRPMPASRRRVGAISKQSRGTHRVAIANSCLIACDDRGITFKRKNYRKKGRTRHQAMTQAVDTLIRGCLIHDLQSDFHRIRHFSLLANHVRSDNIQRLRELLAAIGHESGVKSIDNAI